MNLNLYSRSKGPQKGHLNGNSISVNEWVFVWLDILYSMFFFKISADIYNLLSAFNSLIMIGTIIEE